MPQPPTTIADELGIALRNLTDAAAGAFTPTLRVGVTGLSRAGKTIFITALVHNLLTGGRLPAFAPLAQGRFIGSAVLSNGTEGVARIVSASLSPAGVLTRGDIRGLVDDNGIDPVAYLDLRASWRFSEQLAFYGAIDNLNDAAPPIVATTSGGNTPNAGVYDVLGRTIRIGVRVNN